MDRIILDLCRDLLGVKVREFYCELLKLMRLCKVFKSRELVKKLVQYLIKIDTFINDFSYFPEIGKDDMTGWQRCKCTLSTAVSHSQQQSKMSSIPITDHCRHSCDSICNWGTVHLIFFSLQWNVAIWKFKPLTTCQVVRTKQTRKIFF